MKFNRAAPFLGPFSGPKKWTARCSTRNVPRQRSLLQRDWPGLRLHVPARLAHKSSISSQISFLLFKEGLEPRSKLEQQRKQVFKADLEPLRYTRPLNHMEGPPAWSLQTWPYTVPFFSPQMSSFLALR